MIRIAWRFAVLAAMLLGLPLLGVAVAGFPWREFLHFPPHAGLVRHAPFAWVAFAAFAAIALAMTLPLLWRVLSSSRDPKRLPAAERRPFPWWGWVGVAGGGLAWLLAWTRFPWFSSLQIHTFTPLWISYILVINALTYRRRGGCMLKDRPVYFLSLFPASAVFWWFFEYLNRFVQNWYYVGVTFDAWQYFCYGTLSFSTVLPAVLGTRDWLAGVESLNRGFRQWKALPVARPKRLGWLVLAAAAAGLASIGVLPDLLFPLLWVSPLLILLSLEAVRGRFHLLSPLAHGDWRPVVLAALAALVCGWFWEMWNYFSLVKWQYSVPYVHRFQVFEMPVLGYAGYLPFGLECAVIGELLERKNRHPA